MKDELDELLVDNINFFNLNKGLDTKCFIFVNGTKNVTYPLVISDEVIVVVVDTFLIWVMSFFVFPIKLLVLDNPLPLEPCDSPIPPVVRGVYGKTMWHKYSDSF